MRNIILISTLVLVSMNCDEIFNPDESEDPITEQADTEGNIAIINNSGQKLVLYDAGTPVKIIPNMSEEFLVKYQIPVMLLRIYGCIKILMFRQTMITRSLNQCSEGGM